MRLSKEAKTGIIVTLAILVFYVGFNFLRGIEVFSNKSTYYAEFDNIDGLTVSNPVVINGLNIGRVSKINLDQDRNIIVVELQVPNDLILTDSAVATLVNSDFLGSKAIKLDLNPVGNQMQDGDTLLSQIDPSITEFLRENAQPLANSLNTTIKSINEIIAEFAASGENLKEIVNATRTTAESIQSILAENRKNIRDISGNLSQITEEFVLISKQFPQTLAKFEGLADSLQSLEINRTLLAMEATLEEVKLFTQRLNEQEGTLQLLMEDPALYESLTRSTASLDSLLSDLKDNPNRYVHFSLFGRKNK
jgi:phospholipid/cholesterol/gamma-HCH transport system substrate-binding protein